jgi:hypothetical protein
MLQVSRVLAVAALAFCAAFFARPAHAAVIGFSVNFTDAAISLSNDSAVAEITAYTISIGDPAFNFDDVSTGFVPDATGSFVLVSPDTRDGGVRSDELSHTFTGFLPGDQLVSNVDIDGDGGDDPENTIYGVMFNNGAAPNSVIATSRSRSTSRSRAWCCCSAWRLPHWSCAAAPRRAASASPS